MINSRYSRGKSREILAGQPPLKRIGPGAKLRKKDDTSNPPPPNFNPRERSWSETEERIIAGPSRQIARFEDVSRPHLVVAQPVVSESKETILENALVLLRSPETKHEAVTLFRRAAMQGSWDAL